MYSNRVIYLFFSCLFVLLFYSARWVSCSLDCAESIRHHRRGSTGRAGDGQPANWGDWFFRRAIFVLTKKSLSVNSDYRPRIDGGGEPHQSSGPPTRRVQLDYYSTVYALAETLTAKRKKNPDGKPCSVTLLPYTPSFTHLSFALGSGIFIIFFFLPLIVFSFSSLSPSLFAALNGFRLHNFSPSIAPATIVHDVAYIGGTTDDDDDDDAARRLAR